LVIIWSMAQTTIYPIQQYICYVEQASFYLETETIVSDNPSENAAEYRQQYQTLSFTNSNC